MPHGGGIFRRMDVSKETQEEIRKDIQNHKKENHKGVPQTRKMARGSPTGRKNPIPAAHAGGTGTALFLWPQAMARNRQWQ